MPTYATYDTTTASRVLRWRGRGRYHVAAVWDPPSGFTGARGVFLRKHGGKRHNPRDLSLGANTTAQMFTDTLGAFVIAYDCDPGGFWLGDAEEIDLEFADESPASDALFPMLVRAHCADPWLVGSTRTIDPAPARWAAGGESSGAFDSARAQLVALGGFGDLAARESVRGGRRFRFDPDHRVGHLFLYIGQNRLSSFNEYTTATAGASTFVSKTSGGSNQAGASTLRLVGDTIDLRRANRLRIRASSGATATGSSSGSATLAVSSSFPALRTGTYIVYDLGAGPVELNVVADYAGGAGSVSIFPSLVENIPGATALQIRFDQAVTSDVAAPATSATPVDVPTWPPLAVTIPDASSVELLHFYEGYGPASWASAYLFSGNSGYTWRTFPFDQKREADVDLLLDHAPNPRLRELNVALAGPFGNSLQRLDSLTDPRSFWVRHAGAPAILPERMDLHDTGDMAVLAHKLYQGGARVLGYLGGREDNPGGTSGAVPWLGGRNGAFSSAILAAFLTDPSALGGAFS